VRRYSSRGRDEQSAKRDTLERKNVELAELFGVHFIKAFAGIGQKSFELIDFGDSKRSLERAWRKKKREKERNLRRFMPSTNSSFVNTPILAALRL